MKMITYGIMSPKVKCQYNEIKISNTEKTIFVIETELKERGGVYFHKLKKIIDFNNDEIEIEKEELEKLNEILNDTFSVAFLKERLSDERLLLKNWEYMGWRMFNILIFQNKEIAKYIKTLMLQDIANNIKENLNKVEVKEFDKIEKNVLPYLI
jgi:hypothetical protein